MVHFERTTAFVNRAFAIAIGVLSGPARVVIMRANEAELSQEQEGIKQHYKSFLSELEQNLAYLHRGQHAGYLQEAVALFPLSTAQFQAANDLTQQLLLKHSAAYQSAALTEAKAAILTTPFIEEAVGKAFLLLLIATGGSGYYQKARAEVDRQLRLAGGLIKPESNKALIDALVEKYVPAVRTPKPVEDAATRLDSLEALALEAMNRISTTSPTHILDVGGVELARQITGLSKSRIYGLVSDRAIPHSKRGNKLYFNRADLLAWIENGRRVEAP